MNKYAKAFLIGTMVFGAALLVGLALATRSSQDFENQYSTLLYLNVGVIVVMLLLIVALGFWLVQRFRQRVFGTRLMTRFALSFALLGIVPSMLLFAVSTTFVSRTIDSWFHLKLDSALEAAMSFGRERLENAGERTKEQLLQLAQREENLLDKSTAAQAKNWLVQNQWQTIAVLDASGQLVWQVHANGASSSLPDGLPANFGAAASGWYGIEDESDAPDAQGEQDAPQNALSPTVSPKIHALQAFGQNGQQGFVYASRVMAAGFSEKTSAIQAGLRDYQATEASREGLKKLYRITLVITLLVTSLAALAAAFLIANRMIQPILWLAQATQLVSAGHYALVPQRVKGSDELIQLVDSFGDMAQQLSVTQASLNSNKSQLEFAKAYSEAILQNLSAGVLVFDRAMRLESFNAYANRMFQTNLAAYLGSEIGEIAPFAAFEAEVQTAIERHSGDMSNWRVQQSVELLSNEQSGELIASIQGTSFSANNERISHVLVLNDISAIISAQRTLAWGEVARRLAHEIKNPLTPIQLSAERLQMKLADKLEPADKALLERSTGTIVTQVQSLLNMVNAFRDYAREPEIAFSMVDLNALIQDILVLYESGQGTQYTISTDFEELPYLLADPLQLRQVFHNLIKNAIEASPADVLCEISIQTKQVALQSEGLIDSRAVNVSVRDNGHGFGPKVMARMFEPYNTNKVNGTGLGLPVIKKIIDAHHAKISVKNQTENAPTNPGMAKILGAQIDILFINVAPSSAPAHNGQLI